MYGSGSSQPGQARPLPRVTPLNRPFWEFARRSVFALQVCEACGDAHVPESPVCPHCLGDRQSWKPATGRGTLEAWCDFHRAYWDGFRDALPYRTCVVRLEEGPLVVSNLAGEDADARIGAPVHVVFEKITDEIILPKFRIG